MKLRYFLTLLFTVGVIWYGMYITGVENEMLASCSNETQAIVIDKYSQRKKGYTIKYKYSVNGEKFSTSESILDSQIDSFDVGSTIFIKYSCEDHNVSSIK